MIITAISLREFHASGIDKDELMNYLPATTRKKLERIVNVAGFERSLIGELLSRYSIHAFSGMDVRDVRIHTSEKGKPYLDEHHGIHFNVSHSGDIVACAVSRSDVGIDVEHHRKVNLRVAERFFSASEYQDLMALAEPERQEFFFILWTIKESYLKAIGSGLTKNLNSFSVIRTGDQFMLTGDPSTSGFSVKSYKLPDNSFLSVCSKDFNYPEVVRMAEWKEVLSVFGKMKKDHYI